MKYPISQRAQDFLAASEGELLELLKTLAVIPAPSNHEEERAEFCRQWFEAVGVENVFIDEALNVVCPIGVTADNDVAVIMAHTDVVFPDTTPLPLVIEDGLIKAPGIGDDTANLAVLMLCVKYVVENKLAPKGMGVVFVANSGEEGLGNLKGVRQIMRAYEGRVKEFISFDGSWDGCHDNAAGSHRYKVTVTTEGGHSYGAFGNRNAIAYLASMITALCDIKVPDKAKTTFNVGVISGGTSVNTIAQEASMLYEFRSEDRECLQIMERFFLSTLEVYRNMGVGVELETLGIRPCRGDVDPVALAAFTTRSQDIMEQCTGTRPIPRAASTDANIPLSLGIVANTIGVINGGGEHTREEWVRLDSLPVGQRIGLTLTLQYFNE